MRYGKVNKPLQQGKKLPDRQCINIRNNAELNAAASMIHQAEYLKHSLIYIAD